VIYAFENCQVDVLRRELRRGNDLVPVEPGVFDLLHYLIRNRYRVVSKDDLIAAVWTGRIVSDSTLSGRINAVRSVIGDSGDHQRLIRTIARKGFRFIGDVREAGGVAQHQSAQRDAKPGSTGAAAPQLSEKPSIAVLPFTNMSGDPEQEYFSDGITEDIITALTRLRWFFVVARSSTFAYKGQGVDVRQVGRDLGVRYLLEGSVRKSGQRLRITAQLLDAIAGNHIWAERYDRELTDIFALQDEITASVAASIEPRLMAAEGLRTGTRSTHDLHAWDLVARALSHFWKLTAAESDTAVAILRQAVQRDPNHAPAHSMLAFALLLSNFMGWTSPGSNTELAATLAHRAAELDESDPWAHLALAFLAFTGRHTDEAVRHFRCALDLNPNFPAAIGFMAFAFAFDGQSERAIHWFEQALRMSPRDPFTGFFYGGLSAAHYMAGRYHEAVEWARKAVQLRPGILGAHRCLCASFAQAGRIEEAKAAMSTLRRLQPGLTVAWIKRSVPYTAEPMNRFLDGMRKAGLTE
jgi:TolB-like protein/Tfp pilus assembly protein PilF